VIPMVGRHARCGLHDVDANMETVLPKPNDGDVAVADSLAETRGLGRAGKCNLLAAYFTGRRVLCMVAK
jgi:hypothetical protein